MIDISNNGIITIVHGDTIKVPLFIDAGTDIKPFRYKLRDDDKVFFAIMEPEQRFECAILRHVYTKENLNDSGDVEIVLTNDDTKDLLAGTYYYEIKLLMKNENDVEVLDTIVPRKRFYIID